MPPEQQELVIKAIIVGIALIGLGIWQWRRILKEQEDVVDFSTVIVPNESHEFNELFQNLVEKEETVPIIQPVTEIEEPEIKNSNITHDEVIINQNIDNMISSGMSNREIARILKLSTTEVEMLVELKNRTF